MVLMAAAVPARAQTSNQGATANVQTSIANPVAAPIPAQAPADPKELMALAAKTNGLAGLNGHAWHLKANYQTFDADGKPEQAGVYEEWWAGPDKSKIVYSSPGFHGTEYRDGQSRAITGDSSGRPLQVGMAARYLLYPLGPEALVGKVDYIGYDRKMGAVQLQCVQLARLKSAIPTAPTTCFNKGLAAVRVVTMEYGPDILFNNIVEAGGHYIAKQVTLEGNSIPIVNLNVTTLEFPPTIPTAEFAIPDNAVKTPIVIATSAKVTAGRRISGDGVSYPEIAKEERIQGLVILEAMIDTNGSIADMVVLSDPKELRSAEVKAVKTWKYKPYLLDGEPVEVQTQIDVVFRLDL